MRSEFAGQLGGEFADPSSGEFADPVSGEFTDAADVGARLETAGYLPDTATETVVFLAEVLRKPILVEGPAGVGKTELAKAIAQARGADLVRLQCYEGLDEAKALYEWNYAKQLLRITHARGEGGADAQAWSALEGDIFGEDYLLERPLLRALRATGETVLLVDEIDKADVEFEALLLEILGDFQVTIPELGTVTGSRRPFVVLTSNSTRELTEALKRRCLYLHLDVPDPDRERRIVLARVPEVPAELAEQLVRVVGSLRTLELRKAPSIAETLDWARTLLAMGADRIDEAVLAATIGVLLKHQPDIVAATAHLGLPASSGAS